MQGLKESMVELFVFVVFNCLRFDLFLGECAD